jgi:diguanylate cyclase (GGDEF)-like protein
MFHVSIRLRLVLTLLLVIGAGGILQFVSFVIQKTDTALLQERAHELLDMRDLGSQLEEAIGAQHDAVLAYLLAGDAATLASYHAVRVQEAKILGSSEAAVVGHAEATAALAGIGRATDAWRERFAEPAILLVQEGRGSSARDPGLIGNGAALYAAVLRADAEFDAAISALEAAGIAAMDQLETDQLVVFLLGVAGALAGVLGSIWILSRWILAPLGNLLATARRVDSGEDVRFISEREDEIGRLGRALERMRAGLFGQATEASIVNRFTELTAFVEADGDVARATLDALRELAAPDAGTIHISNRSKDRAIPEGAIGGASTSVIPLGQLAHCPGVRRSSLYVTPDLGRSLSIRCPIYAASDGTLACIPLLALGEVVGAVHLHWAETDALPLDVRNAVTRITDHASLAIANRRLMNALQGMASTDSRTGLPNSRAFDETLASQIANRDPRDPLAVLMLDVDHFKLFNDRNGHPGGDEALRTFARVLQGAVRDVDVAARYGGEEFVVMLPGASADDAAIVAERIRANTEATVIDLAPGHRDKITVSVGVAMWPADAAERVKLLEVADAALYGAKKTGRNRVVMAGVAFTPRTAEGAPDSEPGEDRAAEPEPGQGADHALPPPVSLHKAG